MSEPASPSPDALAPLSTAFGPPLAGFAGTRPGAPAQAAPAYASFWVRVVAALIDGFVTGLFAVPARLVLSNGSTRITECSINASGDITGFGAGSNGQCEVPTGATLALAITLFGIALAAAAFYFGKLDGVRGQSLGKKAMGIRVADAATGNPIGFGRGIGRHFFKLISAAVCLLGFLWAAWDPRKQTWHDMAIRSVVVNASETGH